VKRCGGDALAADHVLCCPAVCPPLSRTLAREELRLQVGTLRFDLNTLASVKPKEEKKAALALRKEFLSAVSPGTGGPGGWLVVGGVCAAPGVGRGGSSCSNQPGSSCTGSSCS
jgi:hypothetical protein